MSPHINHLTRPVRERQLWRCPAAMILVFLVGLSGSRAEADVTGPVCVEIGGVISIDGKHSSGRCIDGTMVRLYGVAAPDLKRECRIGGTEMWRCGLTSASSMLQAVKGRQIECRGNSTDKEGRLVAICFLAGRSINQFMVEMDWAAADRTATSMFNEFEQQARDARRGLWSSDYQPLNEE